jgi:mycobactin polyketide synthetase MbtD
MPAGRFLDGRIPVLLSAHEDALIGQDAAAILEYVKQVNGSVDVPAAVAGTLVRTRRVRRHRALIRARDRHELEGGLRALVDGEEHPLLVRSSQRDACRTAFVFPGQGREWPSMGAEAYDSIAAYRAQAQQCGQAFTAAGLPSPLRYLQGDEVGDFSQTEIQAAHFTHAVSLAEVWRTWGVLPEIVVGHSLGEVAAAYVAGAISLPAAAGVVAARAAVVGRLPGRFGMAALGVGADQATSLIAETHGWLELSVRNSGSSSVVSGDRDAVARCVRLAEQRGIFARELAVDFPAHTSKLETLRRAFGDLLPESTFLPTPVEFVSSARGGAVAAPADFADYWYENLRNTVRFDSAVMSAAERGAGTYIEMSAHPSLLYPLAELVEDALIVGSGCRDESLAERLAANIALAAVHDPQYRWSDRIDSETLPHLWGFPPAPMQAIHLWAAPEPPAPESPAGHPKVFVEEWEPRPPCSLDAAVHPCAVAVVAPGDANDAVAQLLCEAISGHQRYQLAAPGQADVTVVVAPALVQPEVADAVAEHCRRAADVDYHHLVGPNCRRVWLVTMGAEQVPCDASNALPGQAALAAMHRSVGFEFPDVTFAHVDLPCAAGADLQTANFVLDQLWGGYTEIALRRNNSAEPDMRTFVWALREQEQPADTTATTSLDNVVITGGNGTIGMRYARYCIAAGARRVTLLSRSGVPAAAIEHLVEHAGTEVYAPTCDITDARAVAAAADAHAGDGASLLIHAAGAALFAPHDQLSTDDVAEVMSAKVIGLMRMAEHWPLRPNARIMLCSSVSGVWGGHGHAAYGASNRMLDSAAAALREAGLDCSTVRWGLWRDTTIADPEEIARIERSGLIAMDPDVAVATSLGQRNQNPLIFATDLDRLRVFFESQGWPMPLAGHEAPAAPDAGIQSDTPVADVVRVEIAAVLNLDGPAAVDLNVALVDLGVDSMLALDLRDRLRRSAGESIAAAKLLGGMTGSDLIDALTPTT